MKIIINECVASATWVYRKDQIVETDTDENISEAQALRWLEAGIASAVKEPVKKAKRKATVDEVPAEVS